MISWNRFYDPDTGRYVSADPLGLDGGINLYAYVLGNPVNYSDQDGLRNFPFYPRPPNNPYNWGGTSNLPWDNGAQRAPHATDNPSPLSFENRYFCDQYCYDWDPVKESCKSTPAPADEVSISSSDGNKKCCSGHWETVKISNGKVIRPEAR